MERLNVPPLDPNVAHATPAAAPGGAVPGGAGEPAAQGNSASAPATDRVTIRELDLNAAIQILIAEVTLALARALADGDLHPTPVALDLQTLPPQQVLSAAAKILVEALLAVFPAANLPNEAWSAGAQRVQSAFETASAMAIQRVTEWRATPAAIPAFLNQVRGAVIGLVNDDVPAELAATKDWAALTERLRRLRRRRRAALLGLLWEDFE